MKVDVFLKTRREVSSRVCQAQDLEFTSKLVFGCSYMVRECAVHTGHTRLDDPVLAIILFTF